MLRGIPIRRRLLIQFWSWAGIGRFDVAGRFRRRAVIIITVILIVIIIISVIIPAVLIVILALIIAVVAGWSALSILCAIVLDIILDEALDMRGGIIIIIAVLIQDWFLSITGDNYFLTWLLLGDCSASIS